MASIANSGFMPSIIAGKYFASPPPQNSNSQNMTLNAKHVIAIKKECNKYPFIKAKIKQKRKVKTTVWFDMTRDLASVNDA